MNLTSQNATMAILLIADALSLALAIASYFFPALEPLRSHLWGIFEGYNAGLLVALHIQHPSNLSTSAPPNPAPPNASQG
jgi:hypothetical protein